MNTQKKNRTLLFGILGIIFCWFFFGIIFGLIGLITGLQGIKSDIANKGKIYTGLVLSILSIVFAIMMVAIGVHNLNSTPESNVDQKQSVSSEQKDEKKSFEVASIYATYDGDTEEGVEINSDNSGISVTAVMEDGSESSVKKFEVENPGTLVAGETSSFNIKYEDFTCTLEITCTSMTRDQYIEQCEDISYKDLSRTPDSYTGKQVKFKGEIMQVQEDGDDAVYLISVTEDEYGFWEDNVFVYFDLSTSDSRFLEDDIVMFYGEYAGLYSYESIFGEEITVPSVYARYIDLVE